MFGAPALRRGEADQPEGWPTRCRPSFRRHTDVPSKRPDSTRGLSAHGCAESAIAGVSFFLVPSFLDKQER